MGQEIVFGQDARRRLVEGMSIPVRAIAAAYGPSGRGTVYHGPPAAPEILFDGLSIARELHPNDPVGRQGSKILYETMYDFNRDLGDGCSGLALITHGVLARSLPLVQAGYEPGLLAEALLELAGPIRSGLMTVSEPFEEERHAFALCRSAAGGSRKVAEEIVSLMGRLGPEGQVIVKEGHGIETHHTVYPGMSLAAGQLSPGLRRAESAESDHYDDPHVLLCDETIEDFGRLVPILEGFAKSKKSLVIVGRGVTGSALATLTVNVQKAGLKAAAVKVPEVGERVYEVLEDIAALTGGQVVSQRLGRSLQSLRPEMLGQARRAEVSASKCTFLCDAPDPSRVEARKQSIRAEIRRTRYLSYDKEKLEARLARLSGGVAEVLVGAYSASERKQEVLRYQKALHAYQSARRSSVVPGGGSAYAYLASQFENGRCKGAVGSADKVAAGAMAAAALRQPERQLIRSVESDPHLPRLVSGSRSDQPLRVFDVHAGAFASSSRAGVFDSAEIVAEAATRAVSAAATILRSEVSLARP